MGRPVIHIRHDAGVGSPYDVTAPIGQIADPVAPIAGETVITKLYPNSFIQTPLDETLKKLGIKDLVLTGFMTHACINSTARGAFNLGYAATIVANATATRDLPATGGGIVPAEQLQAASLAAASDIFAVIAPGLDQIG
jgi:nicotinamidase-related amidase